MRQARAAPLPPAGRGSTAVATWRHTGYCTRGACLAGAEVAAPWLLCTLLAGDALPRLSPLRHRPLRPAFTFLLSLSPFPLPSRSPFVPPPFVPPPFVPPPLLLPPPS
jgi:hypothetical protein